jgi:glycosyltransferase involved in cell wall biosynthesis
VRHDLSRHVLDPRKLVTVYKGHDLAWYKGTRPAELSPFDVPLDAFVVGVVANQRPRKGLPVLIDSARFLPPEANIHFLLIGRGTDGDEMARRIAATPFPSRFHALGLRDDVLPLTAACHATVLPALRREGLPKTVIESMALGIAPIVTATGGSPELVVDGQSGIVVPPGDGVAIARAIESLRRDRGLCGEMGRLAHVRLGTHFRLEDSIEQTYAVYESMLGQPLS